MELTGRSNKINECFHQLGINSYGALATMVRDKTGREFQQAVMEADAARVDPLSDEEKQYLIELHSFTLASFRYFPTAVQPPVQINQPHVDTHLRDTGLTENWDSLVRTSAPPDNPFTADVAAPQSRVTGGPWSIGPWSTRAGPEAFQPDQRPHGELFRAETADPAPVPAPAHSVNTFSSESFDFDEDQGARDSKYFGMDQHDEGDDAPETASTPGLPHGQP